MSNPITLSTMAGLAIAGAGLGLYLGKSAVSEIDPAHYSSPFSGSSFHADLAANGPVLDNAPSLTETAAFASDLGSGCVGCRTYPEEYYPVYEPAMDSYGSSSPSFRIEPAETVIAKAEEFVAEAPSLAEIEQVVRYAHFRVSQDEEEDQETRPIFAEAAPEDGSGSCKAGTECEDAAPPGI